MFCKNPTSTTHVSQESWEDSQVVQMLEKAGVHLSAPGVHRPDNFYLSEKLEVTLHRALKSTLEEQLSACTAALERLSIIDTETIHTTLVHFLPINNRLAKTVAKDVRTLHQPLIGLVVAAACRLSQPTDGTDDTQLDGTQSDGWTTVERKRRRNAANPPTATEVDKGAIRVVTLSTLEEAEEFVKSFGSDLLFHGTTLNSAFDIQQQKIQLRKSRNRNELSKTKAFYTTTSFAFAANAALEKLALSDTTRDDDEGAAVLLFLKPKNMEVCVCRLTDNDQFRQLVFNNATKTSTYHIPMDIQDAKILRAPICIGMNNLRTYHDVRVYRDVEQLAFKWDALPKIQEALVPDLIILLDEYDFSIERPKVKN